MTFDYRKVQQYGTCLSSLQPCPQTNPLYLEYMGYLSALTYLCASQINQGNTKSVFVSYIVFVVSTTLSESFVSNGMSVLLTWECNEAKLRWCFSSGLRYEVWEMARWVVEYYFGSVTCLYSCREQLAVYDDSKLHSDERVLFVDVFQHKRLLRVGTLSASIVGEMWFLWVNTKCTFCAYC